MSDVIEIALFLAHGESRVSSIVCSEAESDWWVLRNLFCDQMVWWRLK